MKNRKLILIVSLVLAMTMSLGGTLAYLQDSDADVNVMTLGSVTITQNEHQRVQNADGTYPTEKIEGKTSYVLEVFEQNKPLLPIVGDPNEPGNSPAYAGWDETATVRMSQIGSYGGMNVFAGKNAQDKFVTVTNTGKTDAFVRTFVAIEIGEGDAALIGTSYHNTWAKNSIGTVEIDGVKYSVTEYVYLGAQLSDGSWRHGNGILPAGDTTYPSLAQVYLKSKATNEDMVKIDANGDGMLDIMVLSQAIQAAGWTATDDKTAAQVALDTGFGVATAANIADWFSKAEVGTPGEKWPNNDVPGTWVTNTEELAAAIAEGGNIALTNDVTVSKIDLTQVTGDVVINGNNKKITTTDAYGIEATAGKNITISNAEIEMTKEGNYITYAAGLKIANGDYEGATIKLENCKITMANADWAYAVTMPASVKNLNLVIDNCELEGAVAVQCWGDNNTITITNSKLICNYTTNAMYTSYCVALQGDGTNNSENNKLVIDGCEFAYSGVDNFNSKIYSVGDRGSNNTLTVTDCTYGEKIAKDVANK